MTSWIRSHELLAERYGGFVYPWKSEIAEGNGEDAYARLVSDHLSPELDVLEAGCGHGVDALSFAPRTRSFRAYDRVEAFIRIARQAAVERGVGNLEFVLADSSPKRGGRIPAPDASADLIISRRGPKNFILDARRVCRPGATLIQLCYMSTPLPPWNEELPEELRLSEEPESIPEGVHGYLQQANIPLHSSWTFDVPEHFEHPRELYLRLVWNRAEQPNRAIALPAIERIYAKYPLPALRHRRFLWKAEIRE